MFPVPCSLCYKIVRRFEEESTMPYVTSIERLARQEGIEEGILQTSRETLLEVLQVRFEDVPRELVEKINQIESVSVLKTLHRQGITIASVEEFQGWLDQLLSVEQEQEEG
ncbi:MAG: hypothetical protein F6K65_17980 [Moorea sp. SIO3C2]|nr:hypothetical protein [Moorena sp. SIO3C2]